MEEKDFMELRVLYREFLSKHEEYLAAAIEENAEEQSALDINLEAQQQEYIKTVKLVKEFISSNKQRPEVQDETSSARTVKDAVTRDELFGAFSLNTSDYIKAYDGDPLNYHVFTMSFDQMVFPLKDGQQKLTQLLRFTCGDARKQLRGAQFLATNVQGRSLNVD